MYIKLRILFQQLTKLQMYDDEKKEMYHSLVRFIDENKSLEKKDLIDSSREVIKHFVDVKDVLVKFWGILLAIRLTENESTEGKVQFVEFIKKHPTLHNSTSVSSDSSEQKDGLFGGLGDLMKWNDFPFHRMGTVCNF
ncbi:MAG: hypothetical protein WCP97_02485 [bacterium]